MKTQILIGFGLALGALTYAQTSVNAGGQSSMQASTGTVSYSVGQTFSEPLAGTAGHVMPGVQQAFEIYTLGTGSAEVSLTLSVYPNPATEVLYLNIDNKDLKKYSYELFDGNGRAVGKGMINSAITAIPMNTFPAAMYILKVNKGKEGVKNFKVIKKN